MIDPLRSYETQAERLHEITGLVPIQILSPNLHHNNPLTEIVVCPPDDPDGRPRMGNIVGIRLFHGPREIVIENVCINGFPVLAGTFDAAAYAIETPMEPLETPIDANYRGEALRFVAVRWGVFLRERPLCIYARPWGTPAAAPQLCGYLVAEFDQRYQSDQVTDPAQPLYQRNNTAP